MTRVLIFLLYFKYVSAFAAVGGYGNLVTDFFLATPSNYSSQYEKCAYPPPYSMKLFRPIENAGRDDLPWTGVVTGMTLGSIWYWCTDQVW